MRVAILADPALRDYKLVGGLETFANRSFWPNFFSRLVARLQWNPMAIDLTPDARAWQELPAERRRRLMTLLAGFCVGEGAVSEQIAPFADAARQATLVSQESLMAWVFFLQRRDEERHAMFFDRIAAEVLGLPGATPAERRAAARELRPRGGARPLRGAAARGERRARGRQHGARRRHQPLPHAARGSRVRRRPIRAARRPGRRRLARGARGHRARPGRRALARGLRPALLHRDAALSRPHRWTGGARQGGRRGLGRCRPAATRERSASMCAHRLHVSGLRETPAPA